MKIEGKVSTIIFKNESNSWTVMLLKNKSGHITAVGQTDGLEVGDEIELEGDMTTHKVYGEQFKFNTYKKIKNYFNNNITHNITTYCKNWFFTICTRKLSKRTSLQSTSY